MRTALCFVIMSILAMSSTPLFAEEGDVGEITDIVRIVSPTDSVDVIQGLQWTASEWPVEMTPDADPKKPERAMVKLGGKLEAEAALFWQTKETKRKKIDRSDDGSFQLTIDVNREKTPIELFTVTKAGVTQKQPFILDRAPEVVVVAQRIKGIHVSLGIMSLGNSIQQGGAGPTGTTILTQFDGTYSYKFIGLGLWAQFDKHGDAETDIGFGPKLEGIWKTFYAEVAYAPIFTQNYVDRSIATQSGSALFGALGVRVPVQLSFISRLKRLGGFFLQFSYKFRVQTITSKDGVTLAEPIIVTDRYPLFGLGYYF